MAASADRRLRELIVHRKAALLPGAANALAARVIEDLGFEAVYVTGAGVTNTASSRPGAIWRKYAKIAKPCAAASRLFATRERRRRGACFFLDARR